MAFIDEEIPIAGYFSVLKQQHFVYLNKLLKNESASAGQSAILTYLFYNEEACQEEIAKFYNMDSGLVARSVRKLEDQNLINKELDDNNRRRYCLSLNYEGKRISRKIIERNEKWEEEIFSNIDISKEDLKKILLKMSINAIKINEGD